MLEVAVLVHAAEPRRPVLHLQGARGAYEMILMAFEKGELDRIRPFLADDVEASFAEAIAAREAEGLTVEASFLGIKELVLHDATFAPDTRMAEITVRFVGEQNYVVRNKAGEIVEGSPREVKKSRDIWTFARQTELRALGARDEAGLRA